MALAGRIRTIKPEWPQDERRGRISRDARLLELLLRTVADDEGRLRAAPAVLRGTLLPYDDDVTLGMVDGWLAELVTEHLLVLYLHEGEHFGVLPGWSAEQKIDRSTPSRLPPPPATVSDPADGDGPAAFDEPSTIPRRALAPRARPRSKVQGPGSTVRGTYPRASRYTEYCVLGRWGPGGPRNRPPGPRGGPRGGGRGP